MRGALRWVLIVAAVLLLIGLAAYGRGTEHHRGDDVGSHGLGIAVTG